jgi:hypothetical protein
MVSMEAQHPNVRKLAGGPMPDLQRRAAEVFQPRGKSKSSREHPCVPSRTDAVWITTDLAFHEILLETVPADERDQWLGLI